MKLSTMLRFTLVLGGLVAAAGVAEAVPNGVVFITEAAMDPQSPTFEKDLKKAQKASLKKAGASWKIYFVAYLKKPAGATELNLVFYDVAGGKGEQGNAYPVTTTPKAKIIMSDVEVNEEADFKAGHTYEVRVTRLVKGKEDVYARTKIKLE